MHQDQRIGLALGVLLVGACAAFFFRNETRSSAPVPRLQHAQELDDRIAERSTRPYLKGVEVIEAADRNRSRSNFEEESPGEDHGPDYWSPLDPSGGTFSSEKTIRERKARATRLNDDSEIQELAPISIPNGDQALSNPGHSSDPAVRRGSSKASGVAGEVRTHVVQKGETLSSIAAKTLGSPNRFHELFEANQDQLKDPNDVKLGMTLRIPDGRTESAQKPPTNKPHAATRNESSTFEQSSSGRDQLSDSAPPSLEPSPALPRGESQDPSSILLPPVLPSDHLLDSPVENAPMDDAAPTKKFVPARRVPLPGRPAGPQASRTSPKDVGGRKLSQASLESTSGKVAR